MVKVLFGTNDECHIWAKRHGLKRHEWKHWNQVLYGFRFNSDDPVVLGSWWATVRPNLGPDRLEWLVQTLWTRMNQGEVLPEL
jgi:hypothetical protein